MLSAAVNWNRSERRRWRMKRSEIRAALGKVEVASMAPKSFPLSASRTRRWFEKSRGRNKKTSIRMSFLFLFPIGLPPTLRSTAVYTQYLANAKLVAERGEND